VLLLALLLSGEVEDGEAAWDSGDPAGALVHWSLALQEAREAGDVEGEQMTLLRLAMVHRELGKLKEAEELVLLAGLERAEEALSLGLIRMHAGKVEEAEALFTESFKLEQAAGDVGGAANALTNLGNARMAQGLHEEAHKAYTAAHTVFETLGDTDGQVATGMNLGIVARHMGDYDVATAHLLAAAAKAEGDLRLTADARVNLALLYQELGRVADAEVEYEGALKAAQGLKDVGRQATILLDMGTLAHENGDFGVARKRYDRAEDAFRDVGREVDARTCALNRARLDQNAPAFRQLIELAAKDGQKHLEATASVELATLVQDASLAHRALELSEEMELSDVRWRARSLVGQHQLSEGDPAGVESLKAAVIELERVPREDREGLFLLPPEQAYETLVGALVKEGNLTGALAVAQSEQVATNPPVGEPPKELNALKDQQRWLEGQLADELTTNGDTERTHELRAQLSALRIEFANEVDRLRATHPEFDQLVRVEPEDLEAIQSDLAPGVLVLQPILLSDRLVLMVFHRDGLRAVEVEVDGDDVGRKIRRLTRSLRARMIDEAEWTEDLCDELGALLLAPIADELADASVLVVTPTGPFQQLPFGLLRHEGKYLVETTAVASVTHVGSLRGGTPFRLAGEELLLVGNPDGTLPAAEDEVKGIGSLLPGANVHVGTMSRTSLQVAAEGKSTLHLATHGVVDPATPNNSYLVVGPEERLSYREIPGLAPYLGSARLVVLSACESGLPVVAPEAGGEEVAISINGISAQFRRAGVETLVASMWKVDDEGTRMLMEGFYANLADNQNVAEALRASQAAMVGSEFGHPWYWGAFVVVGDWR
jgi:CHAT domain-containing protein/tetratricopeptide (TPR) repeat protein